MWPSRRRRRRGKPKLDREREESIPTVNLHHTIPRNAQVVLLVDKIF